MTDFLLNRNLYVGNRYFSSIKKFAKINIKI